MAPSPEVQALLDLINSIDAPPPAEQSLSDVRAGYAQLAVQPGPQVASVEDRTVPGGPHGPFGVRIYQPLPAEPDGAVSGHVSGDLEPGDDASAREPSAAVPSNGRRGVLVWIHGGGFVIGDLETADSTCRVLANEAGVVVVSVDYHLSPEHPYPAAIDDVVTAIAWVVEHAEDLGVDSTRIAVGGDSAGGNLAAVACQIARAAGGPKIAFQLLVYPAVDLAGDHESRHTNGEGYFLTTEMMTWFGRQYLNGRDPATPRVSPLLATDFARLPPALMLTAGFDPLRDEGIAYADALEAAGVAVERLHFDDEIHGFFDFDFLPDCAVARSQAAAAIRRALAPAAVRPAT